MLDKHVEIENHLLVLWLKVTKPELALSWRWGGWWLASRVALKAGSGKNVYGFVTVVCCVSELFQGCLAQTREGHLKYGDTIYYKIHISMNW